MNESQYITGNPTEEEAAAAIAAIERFLADTTVVVAEASDELTGWQRAAREEALGLIHVSPIW